MLRVQNIKNANYAELLFCMASQKRKGLHPDCYVTPGKVFVFVGPKYFYFLSSFAVYHEVLTLIRAKGLK